MYYLEIEIDYSPHEHEGYPLHMKPKFAFLLYKI